MKAAAGDRMVVAATRLDGPVRDGEVVRTGPDGGPLYLVRWSDTGRESTFFPGPDAHVDHFATADEQASDEQASDEQAPGRPAPIVMPPHTRHWSVDVYLYEGVDSTSAQAVLHGDASTPVTARGQADRESAGLDVPEVSDEVAVGRALQRLGDRLLGLAADDLDLVDPDPSHHAG